MFNAWRSKPKEGHVMIKGPKEATQRRLVLLRTRRHKQSAMAYFDSSQTGLTVRGEINITYTKPTHKVTNGR